MVASVRGDRDRKNKYSQIVDVAMGLFAQNGYDATSIRDICKAVPVNLSQVSYYFGGKRDLYKTILVQLFQEYSGVIDDNIAKKQRAVDELREFFVVSKLFHADNPSFARICVKEGHNPSSAFTEVLKIHESRYGKGYLEDLVTRGIAEGDFSPQLNPICVGRMIRLVVESFVVPFSLDAIYETDEMMTLDEYFAEAERIFIAGLIK